MSSTNIHSSKQAQRLALYAASKGFNNLGIEKKKLTLLKDIDELNVANDDQPVIVVVAGGTPPQPFGGIEKYCAPLTAVNSEPKLHALLSEDEDIVGWLRNYGLSIPEDCLKAYVNYIDENGVTRGIPLMNLHSVETTNISNIHIWAMFKTDKLINQLFDYMRGDDVNQLQILELEDQLRDKDAELTIAMSKIAELTDESGLLKENEELKREIAELRSENTGFQLIIEDLEEAAKGPQTRSKRKTKGDK